MSVRILGVVPIRSFHSGKSRLAPDLDDDARRSLAETLAAGVLDALCAVDGVDVMVLTSDVDVARWAAQRRLAALAPPEVGLDEAAVFGYGEAHARGYDYVAIVHADLAAPHELAPLVEAVRSAHDGARHAAGIMWLAPDRAGDGSNVVIVPCSSSTPFGFAYGPNSAQRHSDAGAAQGFVLRRWETHLGIDIDTPSDLEFARSIDGLERLGSARGDDHVSPT